MKILIHLAHPAQFYLFRNIISLLKEKNHEILITYNEKDVLEDLIEESPYTSIAKRIETIDRKGSGLSSKIGFIQKCFGLSKKVIYFKPDMILGSFVGISLVGAIINTPNIILTEDDFDVIRKSARIGFPLTSAIITPDSVENTNFKEKTIKYSGYHELSYLHPKYFTPSEKVVEKYFHFDEPYFILRLVSLTAHHDKGVKGISENLAWPLIKKLEDNGKVFISSEKSLSGKLAPYEIDIDPIDIHHLLSFAKLYIGDSQTMAIESAVLGTPFIRFNDFAGRINVFDELVEKYKLGFDVQTDQEQKLFRIIDKLLNSESLETTYLSRRDEMFGDKIDVAAFLTWFIDNYPKSFDIMKHNPEYQYNFD